MREAHPTGLPEAAVAALAQQCALDLPTAEAVASRFVWALRAAGWFVIPKPEPGQVLSENGGYDCRLLLWPRELPIPRFVEEDGKRVIFPPESPGTSMPAVEVSPATSALEPVLRKMIRDEIAVAMGVNAERFLSGWRALSIEWLELSARSRSALHDHGVRTLFDLLVKDEGELLAMGNFGKKSLEEVSAALAKFDLRVGMAVHGC